MQRYSQSSVLKRTALELIAEDMLTHAVQGAVNSMAKRMGTKANDWEEDVQNLLKSADFGESDHISRHQLSCALQSLGAPSSLHGTKSCRGSSTTHSFANADLAFNKDFCLLLFSVDKSSDPMQSPCRMLLLCPL